MDYETDLECIISREEIDEAVTRLASQIESDYRGRNPLVIGILKGSFVFMSDLVRRLRFPVEVEFIRVSSYGRGRKTAGKLNMVHGLKTELKGRDIIVVEDIIDTGYSAAHLMRYLLKKKPASLRLCVLTDKPSRRKVDVKIDYLGFTVPDVFLVGYGIDYDEKYRNLPEICSLKESEKKD